MHSTCLPTPRRHPPQRSLPLLASVAVLIGASACGTVAAPAPEPVDTLATHLERLTALRLARDPETWHEVLPALEAVDCRPADYARRACRLVGPRLPFPAMTITLPAPRPAPPELPHARLDIAIATEDRPAACTPIVELALRLRRVFDPAPVIEHPVGAGPRSFHMQPRGPSQTTTLQLTSKTDEPSCLATITIDYREKP